MKKQLKKSALLLTLMISSVATSFAQDIHTSDSSRVTIEPGSIRELLNSEHIKFSGEIIEELSEVFAEIMNTTLEVLEDSNIAEDLINLSADLTKVVEKMESDPKLQSKIKDLESKIELQTKPEGSSSDR